MRGEEVTVVVTNGSNFRVLRSQDFIRTPVQTQCSALSVGGTMMSVPDVLLLIVSKLNSARALPSSSACYILDMDIWTEELAEKSP